jgi:hypothetical protein
MLPPKVMVQDARVHPIPKRDVGSVQIAKLSRQGCVPSLGAAGLHRDLSTGGLQDQAVYQPVEHLVEPGLCGNLQRGFACVLPESWADA